MRVVSAVWRLWRLWPLVVLAPGLVQALGVNLAWDPLPTGDPAVGINIYRQSNLDCTGEITKINTAPLPLVPQNFTDRTVTAGQPYCWISKSVDNQGTESDPSDAVSILVPRPASPTNLGATYSQGSVNLTWIYTPNADPAANFVVYRQGSCSGDWNPIGVVAFPALTYHDASVSTNQTYCYRVTAVDANGGESVPSTALQFQVQKPQKPQNMHGTVVP